MSQAGIINLIENNPSIPTQFNANTSFAVPLGNILNIVGNSAQGVSTSGSGNTLTITVADATTASKGVAQFNPANFTVVAGVVSAVAGGPFVTSVSGTTNRITSTGGTTPVIDIAATYVGQTSITTLGTVSTGIWNGTSIGPTFGGTGQTSYITGDTLYASAANTLSKLPIGLNTQVYTVSGGIPSWQTPTTGTVTSVSGTLNRVTSTGGATPIIDISASYVGQSSITTLGTITTGVWNGTAIDATHGGTAQTTYATGDMLYASGVNTLAKLTTGSNTFVLTLAGGVPTWAAPATSGTVTSVTGTTNRITSSGGATPAIDISASYVGQSSITTLGTITTGVWNGTNIDLAHGGTNASLTASNGGIFYSTASAGAILAGTATANKVLMSGASTTPSWSTPTFPNASATSGKVIISDGTNWIASTPTFPTAAGTNGNVLTSDGTNWTSAAGGGGGALIFLAKLTASASASLDFTTNINSTYPNYLFIIEQIRLATSGVSLKMALSANGLSSIATSDRTSVVNASQQGNLALTTGITITSSTGITLPGNTVIAAIRGFAYLYDPASAGTNTAISAQTCYQSTEGSPAPVVVNTSGYDTTAQTINSVRFVASSGNLTSGNIYMYGIKGS